MTKAKQLTAVERARSMLAVFRSLSPLRVDQVRRELLGLADDLGPAFLDDVCAFAEELLESYLASPVKCNERSVMKDYFESLASTSQRLIAAGELAPTPPRQTETSLALVPVDGFDNYHWCVVTAKAEMPRVVTNAVDAARRRNYLVDSVFEPLFELMVRLDRDRAVDWQLRLVGRTDRQADPDAARDLIRVWRRLDRVPPELLRQVLAWSEDEQVLRYWPAVVEEADRLLRAHGLDAWVEAQPPTSRAAQQLHFMAPYRDDRRQRRWLERAIESIGVSIDFFVKQSSEDELLEPWRQHALFRELQLLDQMLTPVLLMSDLMLLAPTGSYDFAMAVFGFTREHTRGWQAALEAQSKRVIRRLFLDDLKHDRSPVPTITRLSFGNEEVLANAMRELDAVTRNFDSVRQREVVVDKLSGIYSSFREQPLLNQELSRRYRRLMRVLHQDNLRRVLAPELVARLPDLQNVLVEMTMIASESRRFLTMRRALDKTTAEVIAADLDFTRSIRTLRARYLRRLLHLAAAEPTSHGTTR